MQVGRGDTIQTFSQACNLSTIGASLEACSTVELTGGYSSCADGFCYWEVKASGDTVWVKHHPCSDPNLTYGFGEPGNATGCGASTPPGGESAGDIEGSGGPGNDTEAGGGEEAPATSVDCECLQRAPASLRHQLPAAALSRSQYKPGCLPTRPPDQPSPSPLLRTAPPCAAVATCYSVAAAAVLGPDCNGLSAISELTPDGACCTALKGLGGDCLAAIFADPSPPQGVTPGDMYAACVAWLRMLWLCMRLARRQICPLRLLPACSQAAATACGVSTDAASTEGGAPPPAGTEGAAPPPAEGGSTEGAPPPAEGGTEGGSTGGTEGAPPPEAGTEQPAEGTGGEQSAEGTGGDGGGAPPPQEGTSSGEGEVGPIIGPGEGGIVTDGGGGATEGGGDGGEGGSLGGGEAGAVGPGGAIPAGTEGEGGAASPPEAGTEGGGTTAPPEGGEGTVPPEGSEGAPANDTTGGAPPPEAGGEGTTPPEGGEGTTEGGAPPPEGGEGAPANDTTPEGAAEPPAGAICDAAACAAVLPAGQMLLDNALGATYYSQPCGTGEGGSGAANALGSLAACASLELTGRVAGSTCADAGGPWCYYEALVDGVTVYLQVRLGGLRLGALQAGACTAVAVCSRSDGAPTAGRVCPLLSPLAGPPLQRRHHLQAVPGRWCLR